MADSDDPIAWTAIPAKHPVLGADGGPIGHVSEVLGDTEDDIFHGIVLAVEEHLRPDPQLEVTADHITDLNERAIETDLDQAGIDALEPYHESKSYRPTPKGGVMSRIKDRMDGVKDWERD